MPRSNEAAQQPDDPALQLLKAEALLAVGTNDMAENAAERPAQLALDRGEHTLAAHALRLWVTARFRRGQPLSSASIAGLLGRLPADEPGAETAAILAERVCREDAVPPRQRVARTGRGSADTSRRGDHLG